MSRESSEAALPVPLLQLVPQGDPPRDHDVRSLSVELAEGGEPAVRTRDRRPSRDGANVVDRFGPTFAGDIRAAVGKRDAWLSPLAVTSGRDVRKARRRRLLSD